MALDSIDDAIEEIAKGKIVIVVDDEDRENEGDFVMAAGKVTAEAISFMASYGRGLICAPFAADRLSSLGIVPMTSRNGDPHGTAFTVSVDHREATTGISAAERARTLRALADPLAAPGDFRAPGHVFPLAARPGGVLERRGHTEAAVDLARLALEKAGESPAAGGATREALPGGVICEIMKDDGTMARLPDLIEFARTRGLKIISIADLVAWRLRRESVVERVAETRLPTRYGEFRMVGYRDLRNGSEHLALVMGNPAEGEPPLVRVHSECLTGDALGSLRCDCGDQFDAAMRAIASEGRGILAYLRQEGRGIGLLAKIGAYALQDQGMDTVDANLALGYRSDERDYRAGIGILRDLGASRIRLMTNNPDKIEGLAEAGIEIVQRVSLRTPPRKENRRYLRTKAERMGHILEERDYETV